MLQPTLLRSAARTGALAHINRLVAAAEAPACGAEPAQVSLNATHPC